LGGELSHIQSYTAAKTQCVIAGSESACDLQDQGVPRQGKDTGICTDAGTGWLLCAGSTWQDQGTEDSQSCEGGLGHHQGTAHSVTGMLLQPVLVIGVCKPVKEQ